MIYQSTDNNSRQELVEKIVDEFKIAIDFYRMEYSGNLRTLFNEFGYLLLCSLSCERTFHWDEKSSEVSASEIEKHIALVQSEFRKKVMIRDDRLSVFTDFSLSIEKLSVLRQILLVISDLLLLQQEKYPDRHALYDVVCRLHSLCSNSTSKADTGRFFLPDRIVEQFIYLLKIERESGLLNQPVTVLDPQYGTGNMLIAADYYFQNASLFGFENNREFRISAQILSILSGTSIKTIGEEFLKEESEKQYDIVLANPPFYNDSVQRDAFTQPLPYGLKGIKNRYSLFIVRTLQAIAPGGHAVVITPDSFLFSSKKEYEEVRRWLLSTYCLEAVISLPEKTFYPHTATNASALIVGNPFMTGGWQASERTERVLFYQMEPDSGNPEDKEMYSELLQVWNARFSSYDRWLEQRGNFEENNIRTFENGKQAAFWFADIDSIRESKWSLLPEHYKPIKMRELEFEDPVRLLEELLQEQEEVLTDMGNLFEEVRNLR